MTQPTLYVRCVSTTDFWWKAGDIYPVVNDLVYDLDPEPMRCSWNVKGLLAGTGGRWKLVWILPDGTELEALE